jgi:hypothetical protein
MKRLQQPRPDSQVDSAGDARGYATMFVAREKNALIGWPHKAATRSEERLADGPRPSARKHGGCAVVGR